MIRPRITKLNGKFLSLLLKPLVFSKEGMGSEFGGLFNGYQLCCKLRKLKQELKLFNMTHFFNISNRVKDTKSESVKAQHALHTTPENPTLCMRERDVVHKYASTVRILVLMLHL
jgi:hypothetical protein